jgi:nitrogen fixation NifU-like protein
MIYDERRLRHLPERGIDMEKESDSFWQHHSLHFLEMAFRTDRQEIMVHPDGYGKRIGGCGDTVEIFLKIKNDRIESASYFTNGCLNTNACANTVIQFAEGKAVEEAWDITPEAVSEFLQTLPEDHFHCAELAVGALYLALSDVRDIQRSPWKKMYR